MIFKGLELDIGDHITFKTSEVPLPKVEAAVVEVKGDTLEVFSALLGPYQHSGMFAEDVVGRIEIVRKASEAIPLASRGKFVKNEEVIWNGPGLTREGKVVAAFDGIVMIILPDGKFGTSGVSWFTRKSESTMENIELVQGQCPLCGGPIPEDWAGKNPPLGNKCDKCLGEVFRPEHVELYVEIYNAWDLVISQYEDRPHFTGTRVKVNGVIGMIEKTYGDYSRVRFEGDDSCMGEGIYLGYSHLMGIYREIKAGNDE